jgi:hypothetical protein
MLGSCVAEIIACFIATAFGTSPRVPAGQHAGVVEKQHAKAASSMSRASKSVADKSSAIKGYVVGVINGGGYEAGSVVLVKRAALRMNHLRVYDGAKCAVDLKRALLELSGGYPPYSKYPFGFASLMTVLKRVKRILADRKRLRLSVTRETHESVRDQT